MKSRKETIYFREGRIRKFVNTIRRETTAVIWPSKNYE
jgi:preprotein translocase subunit SecE